MKGRKRKGRKKKGVFWIDVGKIKVGREDEEGKLREEGEGRGRG